MSFCLFKQNDWLIMRTSTRCHFCPYYDPLATKGIIQQTLRFLKVPNPQNTIRKAFNCQVFTTTSFEVPIDLSYKWKLSIPM